MLRKRDLDRAAVRQERGGRLEPDQRRAERRALHLLDVIGVIETDRDDLARRDRQVDLEIAQRNNLAGEFEARASTVASGRGRRHRALRRKRASPLEMKPPKVRIGIASLAWTDAARQGAAVTNRRRFGSAVWRPPLLGLRRRFTSAPPPRNCGPSSAPKSRTGPVLRRTRMRWTIRHRD